MERYILITIVTALISGVEMQQGPVNNECLQCICLATSNCDLKVGCSTDTCGPLGITWGYWNDAARPVLDQDNAFADGAYVRCANDETCAVRSLQNYMLRYARDCNGDGQITCYDFAAIHRVGSDACGGQLDADYINKLGKCITQFGI